jgi:hypothetical protein
MLAKTGAHAGVVVPNVITVLNGLQRAKGLGALKGLKNYGGSMEMILVTNGQVRTHVESHRFECSRLDLDSWCYVHESVWTTYNNGKRGCERNEIQGAIRFSGQEDHKLQVQIVLCLEYYRAEQVILVFEADF